MNAETFATNRDRSLDNVRAEYPRSGRELLAALDGYSEADLFDEEGFTKVLEFPALYLIAGDTYMHYPGPCRRQFERWLETEQTNEIS